MANLCDYVMRVYGKKESVDKFKEMIEGNGTLDRVFGRMLYGDPTYKVIWKDNHGITCLEIAAACAWDLSGNLFPDMVDYSLLKLVKEGSKEAATIKARLGKKMSLPKACAELNLVVEAYSAEPGMEFQEHILCKPDGIVINDSRKYDEYLLDTGSNSGNKASLRNYNKDAHTKLTMKEALEEVRKRGRGCLWTGGWNKWNFDGSSALAICLLTDVLVSDMEKER